MNNPNFIIIGAQKASTSSMLHILNQHPDIYLPKNEIDIFEIDNFYDYENFFNKLFLKSSGKINGIKRPNYIGLLDIPEKIESYGNGNIKLIAILRDPVARLISQYKMHSRQGLLPTFNIDKNINKILEKDEKFFSKYPHSQQLLENGLYTKYLKLYDKTLSKDNLLVLNMKELLDQPDKFYKIVFNFLEVEFIKLDFKKKVNSDGDNNLISKKIISYRSSLIYNKDFKSGNIKNKNKLKFYEKFLIKFFNFIFKIANNFNFPNQTLSQATLSKLNKFYSSEIEEVKKTYNIIL